MLELCIRKERLCHVYVEVLLLQSAISFVYNEQKVPALIFLFDELFNIRLVFAKNFLNCSRSKIYFLAKVNNNLILSIVKSSHVFFLFLWRSLRVHGVSFAVIRVLIAVQQIF